MPHAEGYCKSCRTAAVEPGRSRCEACAAARRAQDAAQRADRRERRRCLTCGRKARPGRSYCATHAAYYRERYHAARSG